MLQGFLNPIYINKEVTDSDACLYYSTLTVEILKQKPEGYDGNRLR